MSIWYAGFLRHIIIYFTDRSTLIRGDYKFNSIMLSENYSESYNMDIEDFDGGCEFTYNADDTKMCTRRRRKKRLLTGVSRQRRAANERERLRVQGVNKAFITLRSILPILESPNEEVSKYDTLRVAAKWIAYLTSVLLSDDQRRERVIEQSGGETNQRACQRSGLKCDNKSKSSHQRSQSHERSLRKSSYRQTRQVSKTASRKSRTYKPETNLTASSAERLADMVAFEIEDYVLVKLASSEVMTDSLSGSSSQSQNAVSAHFSNEQLLPFGFEEQSSSPMSESNPTSPCSSTGSFVSSCDSPVPCHTNITYTPLEYANSTLNFRSTSSVDRIYPNITTTSVQRRASIADAAPTLNQSFSHTGSPRSDLSLSPNTDTMASAPSYIQSPSSITCSSPLTSDCTSLPLPKTSSPSFLTDGTPCWREQDQCSPIDTAVCNPGDSILRNHGDAHCSYGSIQCNPGDRPGHTRGSHGETHNKHGGTHCNYGNIQDIQCNPGDRPGHTHGSHGDTHSSHDDTHCNYGNIQCNPSDRPGNHGDTHSNHGDTLLQMPLQDILDDLGLQADLQDWNSSTDIDLQLSDLDPLLIGNAMTSLIANDLSKVT